MPNFTQLEEISTGETEKVVRLSPTTVNLLLALVQHYAQSGFWFTDDEVDWRLDATEQDRADAYQALAIHELLTEVSMAYVGEVRMFATDPPAGWLVINGQEASREGYAELFAAIGTTFGPGDGTTTFNLPDARKMSPQGVDLEDEVIGTYVGTLWQFDLPQHRHAELATSDAGSTLWSAGGSTPARGRMSTTQVTNSVNQVYTAYEGEGAGVDQRGPRFTLYFAIFANVYP
jgi:microcystin-dependent protein